MTLKEASFIIADGKVSSQHFIQGGEFVIEQIYTALELEEGRDSMTPLEFVDRIYNCLEELERE